MAEPMGVISPPADMCRADVRRQLGLPSDIRLVVGVDRLDYTKGLDEKVRAIERLLEMHPEFRERLVVAQIAEPSRTGLAAYQAYRSRLPETTRRVNARFGTASYRAIILFEPHHEPPDVYRYLRAADVCYVGSLHDGINSSPRNSSRPATIVEASWFSASSPVSRASSPQHRL